MDKFSLDFSIFHFTEVTSVWTGSSRGRSMKMAPVRAEMLLARGSKMVSKWMCS